MSVPLAASIPREIVIVGPGRVGSAFVRAAVAAGARPHVIGRGGPHTPLQNPHPGVPIIVCTRADDLAGVIAVTAPENRGDLVFVQNGMIGPLLAAHGLAGATQGLVYFAATTRAGPVEAGAPSLFHGPHAAAMVEILAADRIPAEVVPDREAFAREVGTKLAWNAIFGLLGERYGESVGETVARRRAEIDALAAELAPVLARGLATTMPTDALVRRLVAYSTSIPTFLATVKELPWRNGWIAQAARDFALPAPTHDRLLRETGHAAVTDA
ncbi:MAG: hypothetical protein Q8P41_31315 [Pseudomonadota bacterium]|nr:hypothetical protein [Pseudomonadota bacterium]